MEKEMSVPPGRDAVFALGVWAVP